MNKKAIARTLISAAAAGITASTTGNPVLAAVTYTAVSAAINELISGHKDNKKLSDGLLKALSGLEQDLPKDPPNKSEQLTAIASCTKALTKAPPVRLQHLLVETISRELVAPLLQDQSLNRNERNLAESYLVLVIKHWQKHLSNDEAIVQALRDLIAIHGQRLDNLALAGLEFGESKRYIHGERPPSCLFRPEYGVLPLIGREEELEALRAWCNHEVKFAVVAHAAPGGTGKTRLALQLIKELRIQGWLSAFVTNQEVLPLLVSASLPYQILLVLDYADYKAPALDSMLSSAERLKLKGHKIRLLLLARPDSEWWDHAKRTITGNSELYTDIKAVAPTMIALSPPSTPDSAGTLKVLEQIATYAELPVPEDANEFKLLDGSTPLMWMMAAYRFLQSDRAPSTEHIIELCEQMVMRHERAYLCKKLGGDTYLDGAMKALALTSLIGGIKDSNSCTSAIENLPLFTGADRSQLNKIQHTLKSAYPYGTGIGTLQPDLLAEFLVYKQLDAGILGSFWEWLANIIRMQLPGQLEHQNRLFYLANALDVIKRTNEWSAESTLEELLITTFRELHPEKSQDIAAADLHGDSRLRHASFWASQNTIRNPKASLLVRANALSAHSVDLKNLGNLRDSINTIEKALEIFGYLYKTLKPSDPDFSHTMVCFADCRMNASSRYNEAHNKGIKGAAEKSLFHANDVVIFYKKAYYNNDRDLKLLDKLAQANHGLAAAHHSLKNRGSALRAAKISNSYSKKILKSSAENKNISFYSTTHASLALRFAAFGRKDKAQFHYEESIRIRRELIEKGIFSEKNQLSITLQNYSFFLEEHEDIPCALKFAEEALQVREELFNVNPTAHGSDLQGSQIQVRQLRSKI